MRKSLMVGILSAAVIAAGTTIVWVGLPGGRLEVATPTALAQSTDVNQAITDSGQAAIKAAIASVGPAVVRVDVTGTVSLSNPLYDFFDDPWFDQFFGSPFDFGPQEQETESVGSGVVFEYASEKLVLTNAHVIDNADSIRITDVNGEQWDATVIGTDELLDVAVLRIEGDTSPLSTAVLGDSDETEIGDWAIAIGNPLGLSYTVTLGIISAIDRDIVKPTGVGSYSDLIQTDAAINPGNSGGPLVNANGEVIGINTLIARQSASGVAIEGINFAIAINGVVDILGQLVEAGGVTRGWLGVVVADVTPATAEEFDVDPDLVGALVVDVFPGDPASVAGIEVGDVVTKIGDAPIEERDDLVREIALLGADAVVDIQVLRGDQDLTFSVTLDERPSEDVLAYYEGKTSPETPEAVSVRGITVGPITPIVAEHLGLNSTDGVVIMDIASGSRADRAGLSEGDIILEVDHRPIESVDDWNEAVSELAGDAYLTLTVLHGGRLIFVTL
jgi:serine protease Do